jgi:hypothetical protein
MLVCAAVAGGPRSSRDLCHAALARYHDLFSRLPWMDPEAGFGEVYLSGTRWLEAWASATEWTVPDSTVRAAELVFDLAATLPDDEVADWICLYPRRFLATIDRRGDLTSQFPGGRRAIDRMPTSTGRLSTRRPSAGRLTATR